MNVTLSAATQHLLEARMKLVGYESADEAIRSAFEAMMEGEPIENLDVDTQLAIETGWAEVERDEGIDADAAFAELRRKHIGG